MNNAQVAHKWAAQTTNAGKGSSFYYEGRTIYSYGRHFPIATFTDAVDANGERVVLFTSQGYSNSTAKHINHARSALNGLNVRVFSVPEVDTCAVSHARNVDAYAARFVESLEKASRARKYSAMHMADAEKAQADAADYCAIFGQELPASLAEEINPELVAKLREAAKAEALREAAKREADIAARAAEYEIKAAAWRAGGCPHALEMWRFAGHHTLLRVKGDTIETSRGAVVPVDVAGWLFKAAKLARKVGRGETFRGAPGELSRVGVYNLREIKADGSLVIGCHELTFAEIERCAASLGVSA